MNEYNQEMAAEKLGISKQVFSQMKKAGAFTGGRQFGKRKIYTDADVRRFQAKLAELRNNN